MNVRNHRWVKVHRADQILGGRWKQGHGQILRWDSTFFVVAAVAELVLQLVQLRSRAVCRTHAEKRSGRAAGSRATDGQHIMHIGRGRTMMLSCMSSRLSSLLPDCEVSCASDFAERLRGGRLTSRLASFRATSRGPGPGPVRCLLVYFLRSPLFAPSPSCPAPLRAHREGLGALGPFPTPSPSLAGLPLAGVPHCSRV